MKNKVKKQVKIDLRRFWKRIWKLLEPSQKQIKHLLVLIMAMEMVRLLGPYVLKLVIDKIANFDIAQLGGVLFLVAIMFLINQSLSLVDYITDRKIFDILVDIGAYLANNAHKKMVFLSLGYHEKENTGSKIIKITRGIDKIEDRKSVV